jgi:hypothetical protein
MRRILSSLLLGALVVGTLALLPAARAVHAAPAATTAATIEAARHVAGDSVTPDSIFGKWWRKFRKIVEGFLNFIDGIIDTIGGDRRGGLAERDAGDPSAAVRAGSLIPLPDPVGGV